MSHYKRTSRLRITSSLIAALVLPIAHGGCTGGAVASDGASSGGEGTTTDVHDPTPTSTYPATSNSSDDGTSSGSSEGGASGGETDGTTFEPQDCAVERSEVQALLGTYCAECHSGANAYIYDYVEDLERLLSTGKIVAGDPDASPLYQKIATGLMPPVGYPQPSLAEEQALYDWIDQCTAPVDPPACPDKPFISPAEMIDRMLVTINDLKQVDVDDQPFIRFFTLTHLHNAGICGEQLDLYRHALVKLLNGLSRDIDIHPLRGLDPSVDPGQTIYMIDMRDYGWESQGGSIPDVWELLVENNPFAIKYSKKNAVQLRKLTNTAVPFQMADWFVTDASSAPLYDRILYERVFPVTGDIETMTRFDLEALLGIDVEAAILAVIDGKKDNVIRGGMLESGVSNQHRVIERHSSPFISGHSYWLSHDFLDNLDLSNILQHPLDFVAAGGEIIWTLPNGLQGYLLVDQDGKRLDVASIDIVHNTEHGGEPIVNGTSCMGCHYAGMRPANDDVGPYVQGSVGEFSELQLQQVAYLYPPAPALAKVIDADIEHFLEKLAETLAPPLLDGVEVTQGVHDAFEDQLIDVKRAAAEFGLPPEEFANNLGKLPGLKALQTFKIGRELMRAEFAAAVCTLQLGATKACP
jgi:serine/threonine-protein kinase